MKRQATIRVDDRVRILLPKFVVRVGYPRTIEDYLTKVDEEMPALDALMGRLIKKPNETDLNLLPFTGDVLRVRDRIRRDLAYVLAKKDGFGGRERSLHFIDLPEFQGAETFVTHLQTVVTGTYCPASSGRSYISEDDYDPPCLMNEKRWRIAGVSLWRMNENYTPLPRQLISTDSLAEGTIVVVTKATKTRIEVGDGSHDGWHYTPVEFQKDFEHLPDGAEGYLYENEVVMLAFDRAEEVADGL